MLSEEQRKETNQKINHSSTAVMATESLGPRVQCRADTGLRGHRQNPRWASAALPLLQRETTGFYHLGGVRGPDAGGRARGLSCLPGAR